MAISKLSVACVLHREFNEVQLVSKRRPTEPKVLHGSAEEVEFERLSELIRQIDDVVPQPGKKGIHNIWVVITPKVVSGRRLSDVAYDDSWLF